MQVPLSEELKQNFLKRGFSRRSFGRLATLMTAGAALPFYNESALAQLSRIGPLPPDAVKINANENPMGPCPEAAEAIYNVIKKGGRYLYEETFEFAKIMADQEGLKPNYVQPFAGSSDPLHRAILAFTSAEKPLVLADPGYEAGERAARFIGSKVIKVPLKKDYSHDVRAMAAADPNAGVIYVCNPNNPTGTITPRSEIEWLVANKPAGSIVLLDEAYIHLTTEPFGSDFVAADKDVIILRTFSKLYGMAGLRAGAALGRPDLIEKLTPYGAGALPATGMVGAAASLKSPKVVPERRKIIANIREDVFDWMTKKNYKFVPSVSNKFMVDVGRPGQEVVRLMAQEKVFIGRVWPAWPTYVRVSIGTAEEMEKFKKAFEKVMA
ncbi:MAG: pyridoxal phosphate-dependent aminotransferase [Bryobacteraceae bacterium]|jgi:Histidinol-phosphate/aromatic aminotransferase and cobyric acid decarboxylase|nr:pyridoxal phosphate-dependent aminotransferase [Bryobacteraceae bacterium]